MITADEAVRYRADAGHEIQSSGECILLKVGDVAQELVGVDVGTVAPSLEGYAGIA
jgi:hypothetical protein